MEDINLMNPACYSCYLKIDYPFQMMPLTFTMKSTGYKDLIGTFLTSKEIQPNAIQLKTDARPSIQGLGPSRTQSEQDSRTQSQQDSVRAGLSQSRTQSEQDWVPAGLGPSRTQSEQDSRTQSEEAAWCLHHTGSGGEWR